MRSEGSRGSGHSRFQERIRDVFLVASDLSVCTIQEVSVVLLRHPGRSRRHGAPIDGSTASLGEMVLRHARSDRSTAIWILPAGYLQEGVCAGSRDHGIQRTRDGTATRTGAVRVWALSIPPRLRRVSPVSRVPVVLSKGSGVPIGLPPGFGSGNRSTGSDAATVEVFGTLASFHNRKTLNRRTGAQ